MGNKVVISIESEVVYTDSSGLRIEIEHRKYDDGSRFRTLVLHEDEIGVVWTTTRQIF